MLQINYYCAPILMNVPGIIIHLFDVTLDPRPVLHEYCTSVLPFAGDGRVPGHGLGRYFEI